MSVKQFRDLLRVTHIVEGVSIALLLYSSLGMNEAYLALVRWVIFPLITLSGLLMWQQPRVVKWVRQLRHKAD